MTALLTGLGIGIAFWLVTIPVVILLARRPNEKTNNRSIELMEQRNELDRELIRTLTERLVEIREVIRLHK